MPAKMKGAQSEPLTPEDHLDAIVRSAREKGRNENLEPYLSKARIISQTIHPFMNIHRAFYAGIPDAAPVDEESDDDKSENENEDHSAEDESGSESESDDSDEEKSKKKAEYTEEERKVFKAIMRLERGFRPVVDACAVNPRAFLGLISLISEASSASRGDDTAKLKASIVDLIYEDPKLGSMFAADYDIECLISSDGKQSRGFYHLDTAAHLCPLRLREDFDADPVSFTNEICDGKITIDDSDIPCFMYESGTEYNHDDEYTGLFRGFLLVRTYLAMSTSAKWTSFIDCFDLDGLYDYIVAIFEDNADTSFIKTTLECEVPGLRPSKGKKARVKVRPGKSQTGPGPAERVKSQLDKLEMEVREWSVSSNNARNSLDWLPKTRDRMNDAFSETEDENDQNFRPTDTVVTERDRGAADDQDPGTGANDDEEEEDEADRRRQIKNATKNHLEQANTNATKTPGNKESRTKTKHLESHSQVVAMGHKTLNVDKRPANSQPAPSIEKTSKKKVDAPTGKPVLCQTRSTSTKRPLDDIDNVENESQPPSPAPHKPKSKRK
ncbi:hypothetical protein CPB84DRAFT_1852984 [Gymnopilus junonius]|uniref:Uncharacterized protein n=1 Tax=Gymnopilus junonius TaxID=109634 RepID=A0A9P5N9E4_GYMJU|nr:hypothetical protein CPB84DRAFT_1852984 [Gymnopilus junonius]